MQQIMQMLLFAALGMLFLQGVIYTRDLQPARLRYSLILLVLCAACYLVASDKTLLMQTGWLKFLITAGAIAVPAAFWLMARSLFSDEPGIPGWFFAVAAMLVILGVFNSLSGDFFGSAIEIKGSEGFEALTRPAQQVLSLALVAHALFFSYRGRRNDLLNLRREFRSHFVGIAGVVLLAFAIIELTLTPHDIVLFHRVASVFSVLALTILFGVFALRADGKESLFSLLQKPQTGETGGTSADLPAADLRIVGKLRSAFEDHQIYKEHGLTIAELSDRLDVPEHQLRRVINRSMGFKNFAAFLNSYRLEDVAGKLGDPNQAGLPITTIALDAGFQSLATFNRSFRQSFGVTPSAFRETASTPDQD